MRNWRTWIVLGGMALVIGGVARTASAQSRPLVTEDPETVPAGRVLIETGVDYWRDTSFPASGLRGHLWRIATLGMSVGVSSIAEIQIDGGIRNRLIIRGQDPTAPLASMLTVSGARTADVEDLTIGAKIRFVSETASRPALAFRFSTKLPNAGNESGLGLDTTDVSFGFAAAKTVESVRIVGNLGVGILGDPTRGDRQNDVLTLGVSMARAVRAC
jgi:Putative MetA-pathway of phenol degradation